MLFWTGRKEGFLTGVPATPEGVGSAPQRRETAGSRARVLRGGVSLGYLQRGKKKKKRQNRLALTTQTDRQTETCTHTQTHTQTDGNRGTHTHTH